MIVLIYKHRMVEIKLRQSPYTLLDPAQYWLVKIFQSSKDVEDKLTQGECRSRRPTWNIFFGTTLRDDALVDRVTVNAIVLLVPPAAYRILWEDLI